MDTVREKFWDSLAPNDLDLSCFKPKIGERGSSESELRIKISSSLGYELFKRLNLGLSRPILGFIFPFSSYIA